MVGDTSEMSPETRLIVPKAVAAPDPSLYLAMSFCLLTLSSPKVNPGEQDKAGGRKVWAEDVHEHQGRG
jgi:hypothetical protein